MASLYFYYSSMNAGKTTTLLQSSYNYGERGMRTLLFTPDFDNRYATGFIHSRIGLTQPAHTYSRTFNFVDFVRDALKKDPTPVACILVDEAHFLNRPQVEQLCTIVDEMDIPVLAYGLRTDYMGDVFEGSQYLLAWAEHLVELKTICHCGRKATMNARLTPEGKFVRKGPQVAIGGNDAYTSVCRKHYHRSEAELVRSPVQKDQE